MARRSTDSSKRDEFSRFVELYRCALPLAGLTSALLVETLVIGPYLPRLWSVGDWTLFVIGWTPLAAAGLISMLYVPARNLFCGACGKHLSSKEPWICGYCKADNRHTSFLVRCRTCRQAPKAMRCPWCHTFIYLGKEEDETNSARCMREQRPMSNLSSVVRQVERAATLRLASAAEGTKLQMLLFLDPQGAAAELRWFAQPTVTERLLVEGYHGNKQLFRQTGWEGSHPITCPPGEHVIRLLYVAEGSTTKVEDVVYRLVVSPAEEPKNAPPSDPIAAAIAELEHLTLTPLALDEWAIKKESELREKWSKELDLNEVNGLAARFRSSTKIARSRMEK